MFVIHVQAELLLFKVQGVPKIHKILNPRKSQNIDRRTNKANTFKSRAGQK